MARARPSLAITTRPPRRKLFTLQCNGLCVPRCAATLPKGQTGLRAERARAVSRQSRSHASSCLIICWRTEGPGSAITGFCARLVASAINARCRCSSPGSRTRRAASSSAAALSASRPWRQRPARMQRFPEWGGPTGGAGSFVSGREASLAAAQASSPALAASSAATGCLYGGKRSLLGGHETLVPGPACLLGEKPSNIRGPRSFRAVHEASGAGNEASGSSWEASSAVPDRVRNR